MREISGCLIILTNSLKIFNSNKITSNFKWKANDLLLPTTIYVTIFVILNNLFDRPYE